MPCVSVLPVCSGPTGRSTSSTASSSAQESRVRQRVSRATRRSQLAVSRPPHAQSTRCLKHDPTPSRSRGGGTLFQVVPHLVELDHPGPALRLGLLGVGGRERLQPSLNRGGPMLL